MRTVSALTIRLGLPSLPHQVENAAQKTRLRDDGDEDDDDRGY